MSEASRNDLSKSSFKFLHACELCKDIGAVQDLENVYKFCLCAAGKMLRAKEPIWCDQANAERVALVSTLIRGLETL